MGGMISMQTMRYINLFSRITGVKTRSCFFYNNFVIYVVPGRMMKKALGERAINVKKIQEVLGKRIKIVREAAGVSEAERFVGDIVSPLEFKDLKIKDGKFVLTAGMLGKAALIGRHRQRETELSLITSNIFGKELKVI